jgi:hypothetical protein
VSVRVRSFSGKFSVWTEIERSFGHTLTGVLPREVRAVCACVCVCVAFGVLFFIDCVYVCVDVRVHVCVCVCYACVFVWIHANTYTTKH